MDIKELDKKQLILLTLLITFVVSIATGIVTVSLMNQMPKSVPQTINNVIQRTIEKVTTVETPATNTVDNVNNKNTNNSNSSLLSLGDGDALISVYLNKTENIAPTTEVINIGDNTVTKIEPTPIGQGIIISDVGLIMIDSSLVNDTDSYKVVLNKTDFNASILKKFSNGFTVLKISPINKKDQGDTKTSTNSQ